MSGPDVRTPALVCAVLSAAQVVVALVGLGVPAIGLGAEPILWLAVLLAVLHVQQLAAVLALTRSGLVGTGAAAALGLGLTAVGGVAFLVAELIYLGSATVADTAFTIASIATGLGMIVAGTAVLRTRRWCGTARFLPLAIGGYVFAVLTPVLVATSVGLIAIAGWAALWWALGMTLSARAMVELSADAR